MRKLGADGEHVVRRVVEVHVVERVVSNNVLKSDSTLTKVFLHFVYLSNREH